MKRYQALIAGASLALLIPAKSFADVTITYSNPIQQGENMVMTVVGNRAAMSVPGPDGQNARIVFDKSADKLLMVMDDKMQYMDMDAMMESLGGLSDMLAGMMENMPEDAQAQMGGILGGLGGQQGQPMEAPEVVATGKTDSVAGVKCAISTMQAAGNTTEMCLAQPGDVGISDTDFALLRAMMKKQSLTSRQAGQILGIKGLEFSPAELDGVPVRIKQLTGPEAGTVSEFQGTSADVDASAVAIPDNYQAVTIMGG